MSNALQEREIAGGSPGLPLVRSIMTETHNGSSLADGHALPCLSNARPDLL